MKGLIVVGSIILIATFCAVSRSLTGYFDSRFDQPRYISRLFRLIAPLFLLAGTASAHPLGDNAVNRHADIEIGQDRIRVQYLLDMAEIPTLFASLSADANQDDSVSDSEWRKFAREQAKKLRPNLGLALGETQLDLELLNSDWRIKPGNAGLPVLRLAFNFSANIPSELTGAALSYQDASAPDQPGWKGVTVKARRGVELASSDVGSEDPTHGLTVYPSTQGALRDQTAAHATWSVKFGSPINLTETAAPSPVAVQLASPVQAPTPVVTVVAKEHSSNPLSFFFLGIHHIAIGWDHLAFLLGLVLLSPIWRQLVKIITAFTVAHSLTLTLAAFGFVYVPGAWVEPAIAATVAYVGWLSLAGRKTAHGVGMAFGFGLIHGLGFAGAFAEAVGQSSLASDQLLDLLSFNVGIETFQLALIGLVIPTRAWLTRYTWTTSAQRVAALGVMSFGLGWFYLRTLGTFLGEIV